MRDGGRSLRKRERREGGRESEEKKGDWISDCYERNRQTHGASIACAEATRAPQSHICC